MHKGELSSDVSANLVENQETPRRREKFLHTHKLWRSETAARRLAVFAQADQFKISEPIIQAKSRLALSLCELLRTLQQQLDEYRRQIEALSKATSIIISLGVCQGRRKCWLHSFC